MASQLGKDTSGELPAEAQAHRPQMIRAPLIAVALALAAGITAGRYCPWPVGLWLVCLAGAIITALATFSRHHLHRLTAVAILVAIISLGAIRFQTWFYSVGDDSIVTYTQDRPVLATIRGRVESFPVTFSRPASQDRGYSRPPQTRFAVSVDQIKTKDGWAQTSGLVRVTVQEPVRNLPAGAEVQLPGWLGRYRKADNPGQYDRAKAARLGHTHTWLTVPASDGVTVLSGADPTWYKRMLWNLRASTSQHLLGLGVAEEGYVLNALLIGQRHPILHMLNKTMMRTGVAHLMSISGLHLGIFLSFIYLLFRLASFSPRRAAAVVLAVLVGYVLLAEPRAPLLRSAIMAGALCLSQLTGRKVSTLNSLALAGIILLAIDPAQLFGAGFQLSFAIVACVIGFNRPMRNLLFSRWLRRRGLMVFRDPGQPGRWIRWKINSWLMEAVSMSLVAFISAAPLVAFHFGLFSPFSPVLSLLLLPLLVAVLLPGYLSVALVPLAPNLSFWVGKLAAYSAEVLTDTAQAFGKIGWVSWQIRPVDLTWVVTCYLALAAIALSKRLRLGPVLVGLVVAVCAGQTILSQLPADPPETAELNILAVGAGQCAILRVPSGETYLFDAGTQSDFDVYSQVIEPFFRRRKLPYPKAAFISHANTDHFNGLGGLLDQTQLGRVYLNDYFADHARDNPPAGALLAKLASNGTEIVYLRKSDVVQLDSRTSVQVLWPPSGKGQELTVNDTSLVLKITCDDKSVLLCGDLDEVGQAALSAQAGVIQCDGLIVPHHGGWEPTLPQFVTATGAQVILVSNSYNPRPPASNQHADRFYAELTNGYHYLSTARNGWIQLKFGGCVIALDSMR